MGWWVLMSTPRLPFQCREVCGLNASDRCAFVRTNPDCRSDGGYLDYLEGIFCHFPARLLPLAITLYVRLRSGPGADERGPWPQQDLMLFPISGLPLYPRPGFPAGLSVSDSGSHRSKVVSLALA